MKQQNLPLEFTFRSVILMAILAILFTASTVYLGLKAGLVISISIPCALIAMSFLRFFPGNNILENNIVQTGASSAAAIGAGIIFALPAMLMIGAWHDFSFFKTFWICITGGILGVIISIPVRRALINEPHLPFPEGRAIAEVLKSSENDAGADTKPLFVGGIIGGIFAFLQNVTNLFASTWQTWQFSAGNWIYGFGLGFDPSLLGIGYLIGADVALSVLLGGLIGWEILCPMFLLHQHIPLHDAHHAIIKVWELKTRYIAVGGLLMAALLSIVKLVPRFFDSIKLVWQGSRHHQAGPVVHTDRDMSGKMQLIGLIFSFCAIIGFLFTQYQDFFGDVNSMSFQSSMIIVMIIDLLVLSVIFSIISAYFSGLVGVTISPVSVINVGVVIIIGFSFQLILWLSHLPQVKSYNTMGAGLAVLVTCLISITQNLSNNTIQDLKTGQLVGATPANQQWALIIGVIISALVVAPIVSLLYHAYGIGSIFPRPGMDPSKALLAPQAVMLATLAKGLFLHQVPWKLLGIGGLLAIIITAYNSCAGRYQLSATGFAMGIYLPLFVTIPIFLGGILAFIINRYHDRHLAEQSTDTRKHLNNRGIMLSSGLIAGGSVIAVLLAIPVAFTNHPFSFPILPLRFYNTPMVASLVVTFLLGYYGYRITTRLK